MQTTGGCQCGAVRYRAEGPRDRASICYCRMCQRASGGPFMAFVRFRRDQVNWSNQPAIFASSNIVERGFCKACGTPLSYRNRNSDYISLTLHSLDYPDLVQPEMRFSPEAEPSWCRVIADLPAAAMAPDESSDFISYQHNPEAAD